MKKIDILKRKTIIKNRPNKKEEPLQCLSELNEQDLQTTFGGFTITEKCIIGGFILIAGFFICKLTIGMGNRHDANIDISSKNIGPAAPETTHQHKVLEKGADLPGDWRLVGKGLYNYNAKDPGPFMTGGRFDGPSRIIYREVTERITQKKFKVPLQLPSEPSYTIAKVENDVALYRDSYGDPRFAADVLYVPLWKLYQWMQGEIPAEKLHLIRRPPGKYYGSGDANDPEQFEYIGIRSQGVLFIPKSYPANNKYVNPVVSHKEKIVTYRHMDNHGDQIKLSFDQLEELRAGNIIASELEPIAAKTV